MDVDALPTNYTPGPWTATVSDSGDDLRVMAGDEVVLGGCGCCGSPYVDKVRGKADAALIAAAPSLVELAREQAAALLALRAELAQFHDVVIPSWKGEEEAWERERDALRAERDALRSKLREWADECRECHGAGTVPHLFHDGDEDCLACSHIRALLPAALAPAEQPAGKGE